VVVLVTMIAHPACSAPEVQRLKVEVLRELPHDPDAFTQGLLIHDGQLFESTGQYGGSSVRRVEIGTGEVEQIRPVSESLFGEGLARVEDRLIQITWHAGLALFYDLTTFEPIGTRRYQGKGWGLCHHQGDLMMSNGTSWITRRDVETLVEIDRRQVLLEGQSIDQINELECAEGWIYANIWHDERILRIDPETGEVVAVIDASALRPRLGSSGQGQTPLALNGIAFNPETATFYVTGKYWPKMFEVIFVE
jgi:glutamine cyclotransferase